MTVAVYVSKTIDVDWQWVPKDQIEVFRVTQKFLSSTADIKVACLEMNYVDGEQTPKILEELKLCDLIIVKTIEMHDWVEKIIHDYDWTNITYIIPGKLITKNKKSKILVELNWICNTAYRYQQEWRHILENNLRPFEQKEIAFDLLYGMPHYHRVFIKNCISATEEKYFLQSNFFDPGLGYSQNTKPVVDDSVFWEDDLEIDPDNFYKCVYNGEKVQINCIVPTKVYNKTAYSLITETNASNNYVFLTEKITKPILACRLFIVVSGCGYLKYMQELGFKTFAGVIDESYDQIQNNEDRWQAAYNEAVLLAKQPQQDILRKVAPIVIHNFSHLRTLQSKVLEQELESFILSCKGIH